MFYDDISLGDDEEETSWGEIIGGVIAIILALLFASAFSYALYSDYKENVADCANCSGAIVKTYYVSRHSKIIHCLTVENGVEKIEIKQIWY